MPQKSHKSSHLNEAQFQGETGPFALATETSHLAMVFTDGQLPANPVVFANDAFLSLTGSERGSVIGKPVADILDAHFDSPTVSLIQQAIAASQDGMWTAQLRRVDRAAFPAFIFLSRLIGEDRASPQNIISIATMSEASTKEDVPFDQISSNIYEKAPGFIATTEGENHIITFANASFEKFVGRKSLVGLSVAESLPEVVDQGIIGVLDEVYRTGNPFVGSNMPLDILDAESNALATRCIDVVYQPTRDANGAINGIFCEGYDVTGMHEANKALTDLQSKIIYVSRVNAMGTMAATLAHELTQPLCAISNYIAGVDLNDPSAIDGGRLAKALRGIDEASKRAAAIVLHLRDLTRQRKPTRTAFNLKSSVEECVRLVAASAAKDVQFKVLIPTAMTMWADRTNIQQVVINLLSNACDAMLGSDHRVVTVSAKDEAGCLIVSVTDTGPGVPLEAVETIFSWSHSSKRDGMGLGLSISRTILDMHDGRIWLEKSDAGGSEFCFAVPSHRT